eukprot:m.83211 g.83211  ORF g.83211 m.83211 type:complete len:503 (-) comp12908_c0_seq2:3227-4735(-)
MCKNTTHPLKAPETKTTNKVSLSLNQRLYNSKNEKKYTLAEVGKHCTTDSCWLVVDGRVFDVTKLLDTHPGGHYPILSIAGRDVSTVFHAYHPKYVADFTIRQYYIGTLAEEDCVRAPLETSFSDLYQTLVNEGLFDHRPNFFTWMFMRNLCIFILAWACVLYGGNLEGTTTQYLVQSVLGGILLGVYWQQAAFLGHDLGHTAVTYSRYWDHMIGIVCGNFLGGISIGWWKDNHNSHHVVTNSVSHDPDVQHPPFFAVSDKLYNRKEQDGKPVFSHYYGWVLDFQNTLAQILIKFQHVLVYPILMFARLNLYFQSYNYVLGSMFAGPFLGRRVEFRWKELIGLLGFAAWLSYMTMLVQPGGRLTFLLFAHCVSGMLHLQIIISHFSSETYEGVLYGNPVDGLRPEDKDTFPAVQLMTTLNIDCPRWMDWFHGGLQYQIEHHLFPKIPRHNLRRASVYIKDFATRHKLPYTSLTFLEANKRTVNHLRNNAVNFGELLNESIAG